MLERRPALGKGLSALIPDVPEPARSGPMEVDIDLLAPNPQQPRLNMDDGRLEELTASIKSNGIIQPILVRRTGNTYRIIAGERRWRAAQRAGLAKVPVVVRDIGGDEPKRRLEMALIENVQREDLNPIEEAHAYQRLVNEFEMRHEDVAAAVGKDRSTVANTLRLLKLPAEVREDVAAGHLSMGHARAIVALAGEADQRRVAREVLSRGLSVRETEAIVKKTGAPDVAKNNPRSATKDVHTRAAEEQLRLALGTTVTIKRRGKGGAIEIAYRNDDELQRLYEHLTDTRR
jgi:ParB family transcriptional regulator, chromosome partitioning protein